MSAPRPELIDALRATAQRIQEGARFQWTHMGRCNCGHLASTVTQLPPEEIHRRALEKPGDWTEQAREYCPSSGLPMDHIIESLLELGLSQRDLGHLENLDDSSVLRVFPPAERHLDRRRPDHAARYMQAWADLLSDTTRV